MPSIEFIEPTLNGRASILKYTGRKYFNLRVLREGKRYTHISIGNEDLDKALIELSNAREILNSKNQNFSFLKEIINLRMANIFIVLEDLESAKNILEVPFSTNLVNKLILQGDILTKENNFIEAKQKYNQALEKSANESQKKLINLKISTLVK